MPNWLIRMWNWLKARSANIWNTTKAATASVGRSVWRNTKSLGRWSKPKAISFASWSWKQVKRGWKALTNTLFWLPRKLKQLSTWGARKIGGVFAHAKRVAKSSDEQVRPVYVWIYATIVALLALMIVVPLLVSGFTFSFASGWTAMFAFAVVYAMLSYHQSKNDEGTAVWFLGVPVWRQGPGPAFVPAGFGSYDPVPQAILQREFPDEPEMVFKGEDKDPLKTTVDKHGVTRQQVRPIRVTTGGPTPKANYIGGPHLNYQMTVEQQATVRYSINPDRPFDFLIKLPGDSLPGMFGYLEKQMEDTLIDTIRGEFTGKKIPDPTDATKTIVIPRSIGMVIADLDDIREAVERRLKELTGPWGVDIHEVTLKSPDITRDVNVALRNNASASADADTERNKGVGEGDRRKEFLTRQAEGAKAAAVLADTDPMQILALEKAAEIMKGTDKVVLGIGGIAEALNVKAITDAFAKKPQAPSNGTQGTLPPPSSQGGTP